MYSAQHDGSMQVCKNQPDLVKHLLEGGATLDTQDGESGWYVNLAASCQFLITYDIISYMCVQDSATQSLLLGQLQMCCSLAGCQCSFVFDRFQGTATVLPQSPVQHPSASSQMHCFKVWLWDSTHHSGSCCICNAHHSIQETSSPSEVRMTISDHFAAMLCLALAQI